MDMNWYGLTGQRGRAASTLVFWPAEWITGALAAPVAGSPDLCINFAQKGFDPLWVLNRVTLKP